MLGFTEDKMPSDKVLLGLLINIMKVPSLSASMFENIHGYILLAWKGVDSKMPSLCEYNLLTMPHLSDEQLGIGQLVTS